MDMSQSETGQVMGTKDEDAERDGDSDLADFFRRAQGESRKGAEQARRCCASASPADAQAHSQHRGSRSRGLVARNPLTLFRGYIGSA